MDFWMMRNLAIHLMVVILVCPSIAEAQSGVRARDLGVPLEGTPGEYNAITDVAGIEVGHVTLISGSGRRVRGEGPIRTGVTAILPRGRANLDPVFAGAARINGNGEITGTEWIEESGYLNGPIMLTNSFSVGVVRDAVIEWQLENAPDHYLALPVVGETSDRLLNDRSGFHVRKEHAFEAIDAARSGPVAEGAVGSGTGTMCHLLKAGIGTASRVLPQDDGGYTVGVLVQCNYGSLRQLRIAGVPVGPYLTDLLPCHDTEGPITQQLGRRCSEPQGQRTRDGEDDPGGSIIIVVATDAPLLPHQLERMANRTAMGLARMGSISGNTSGDLALAFSTANPGTDGASGPTTVEMLPNGGLNPLFEATIQATEEAILNSLIGAETMIGADYIRVQALPHERLREILRRYNRLADQK